MFTAPSAERLALYRACGLQTKDEEEDRNPIVQGKA
jgi:hypothetical protein